MRLRVLFLAALVVLPGAMTGCGGSKKAPVASAPDPTSNEVRQFHEALRDGDVEIVRRLLAAKPYLANARNEQGITPLKAAQAAGNDELARLLKDKGARE